MKFYILLFFVVYLFAKSAVSFTDEAKKASSILIEEVTTSVSKFDDSISE